MDSKQRIANALKVATDTLVFEMGPGVSVQAPDVFKRFFPVRKAKIIADINTWPALGEKVYGLFVEAGIPVEKYIIMEKEFHAEWEYIEMVDKELDAVKEKLSDRICLTGFIEEDDLRSVYSHADIFVDDVTFEVPVAVVYQPLRV